MTYDDTTPDDAYDTLGIARGCGEDDVRAAFRRAVVAVHPDTAPAGEADPRSVTVLVRARDACLVREAGGDDTARANARIDDILREHGRSRPFPGDPSFLPRKGKDLHVRFRPDAPPVPGDRLVVPGLGRSCDGCAGKGVVEEDEETAPCGVCAGRGWWSRTLGRTTLRVECVSCRGMGVVPVTVPCPSCEGMGKSDAPLVVRVPAAWRPGDTMRVPGAGRVGANGGAPGDAVITLRPVRRPDPAPPVEREPARHKSVRRAPMRRVGFKRRLLDERS